VASLANLTDPAAASQMHLERALGGVRFLRRSNGDQCCGEKISTMSNMGINDGVARSDMLL
jgi:hypothetical protein